MHQFDSKRLTNMKPFQSDLSMKELLNSSVLYNQEKMKSIMNNNRKTAKQTKKAQQKKIDN
jgi:hypothetical protein